MDPATKDIRWDLMPKTKNFSRKFYGDDFW
jgi:hypothetical protein